ncbi:MAG: hypothetical protein KGH61_01760 [Candidatus Micrarchaeota archaeon]|nr:hypothetical protein [Candidatus Micrarchaeota archaeon]MDE1847656.1 hypothetical protein [Candidatus Micrarchaeota archaeon]MDE1864477.1 hypothetical protein [Candidatus Micrarchaeota archaeon]
MDAQTREWVEIIVWLLFPVVFFLALALTEYVQLRYLAAAIFVLLALFFVVRRAIITAQEMKPIVEAGKRLHNG